MTKNSSTAQAPNLMLLANLGIEPYDYSDTEERPYHDPEIKPGDIPVVLYAKIARYCNASLRRRACDVLADLQKPTPIAEEILDRGTRLRAIKVLRGMGVMTTPELSLPAVNLIKRLDLSARIGNMIEGHYEDKTVRDLAEDVKHTDLTVIHNFGRKSERELREKLAATGTLQKV